MSEQQTHEHVHVHVHDDGLCHGHTVTEYVAAFGDALDAAALDAAERILVRFAYEHPKDEGVAFAVMQLAAARQSDEST